MDLEPRYKAGDIVYYYRNDSYYVDNDIVEEAGCYASRDEVISALLQLVESIRSEDCQ